MAWCMHAMWMCPAYKKEIGGGKDMDKEKKGGEKKGEEKISISFFL